LLDDWGDRLAFDLIPCRKCGARLKMSRSFLFSMSAAVGGTFVWLVASGTGAILFPGLLVPALGWFGRYRLVEGETLGTLPDAKARLLGPGTQPDQSTSDDEEP